MTAIASPTKTLTVAEFMALPEDADELDGFTHDESGYYELVDGEIMVKKGPGHQHGRVATRIVLRVGTFVEQNDLGEILIPTAFELDPRTAWLPDVAFITKTRMPTLTTKAVPIPPDLAVEVISPTDIWDNIVKKVQEYQQAGVSLVWVIDLTSELAFVYRLQTGLAFQVLTKTDALDGENVVPGFTLKVADLFA